MSNLTKAEQLKRFEQADFWLNQDNVPTQEWGDGIYDAILMHEVTEMREEGGLTWPSGFDFHFDVYAPSGECLAQVEKSCRLIWQPHSLFRRLVKSILGRELSEHENKGFIHCDSLLGKTCKLSLARYKRPRHSERRGYYIREVLPFWVGNWTQSADGLWKYTPAENPSLASN
jgi:hypothetical protein